LERKRLTKHDLARRNAAAVAKEKVPPDENKEAHIWRELLCGSPMDSGRGLFVVGRSKKSELRVFLVKSEREREEECSAKGGSFSQL